jgi:hypothetical protein
MGPVIANTTVDAQAKLFAGFFRKFEALSEDSNAEFEQLFRLLAGSSANVE